MEGFEGCGVAEEIEEAVVDECEACAVVVRGDGVGAVGEVDDDGEEELVWEARDCSC